MADRNRNQSRELQNRAERLFPGGVNSPVRGFRSVGGEPPFVSRAEGAYLFDADGNRYIDYFGSWGPMILGHAFPPAVEAIAKAARLGQLWRFHTRRGRPGGIGNGLLPGHRENAICQFRHRSNHVRDSRSAGGDRAQADHQV